MCSAPAPMADQVAVPIWARVVLPAVVPSPIWPSKLEPQAQRVPGSGVGVAVGVGVGLGVAVAVGVAVGVGV